MARSEHKELSETTWARWSNKDEAHPFELIQQERETAKPETIKLTPEEARELIIFLTRWLYEYI